MQKHLFLSILFCIFLMSCKSTKQATSTSTTSRFSAQQWQRLKDSLRLELSQNICFTFDSAIFSTNYATENTPSAQPPNINQQVQNKGKIYGARLKTNIEAQSAHYVQQASQQQTEGGEQKKENKQRNEAKPSFMIPIYIFAFILSVYILLIVFKISITKINRR